MFIKMPFVICVSNECIGQEPAELHGDGHHVLHQPALPDGDLVGAAAGAQQTLPDVHPAQPHLRGERGKSIDSFSLSR